MMMRATITPRGARLLLPRHGSVLAILIAATALLLSSVTSTTFVSAWTTTPSSQFVVRTKSVSQSFTATRLYPNRRRPAAESYFENRHENNNNAPSSWHAAATVLSATKIPGKNADAPSVSSTSSTSTTTTSTLSILAMKVYAGVTIFYWYWLVLGAVGQANGWPGIPHWLPPNPTFPPSDAELQTLLDDSSHFLYLSDVLNPTNNNNKLPIVPAWRLAFFNTVEAWVIAFLPLLWKDQRRWPRPVLFLYWSIGCVFLTNAFLAPYLLITEFTKPPPPPLTTTNVETPSVIVTPGRNRLVSGALAAFCSAVVLYGLSTITADNGNTDMIASLQSAATSWWEVAQDDRSILAYGSDLVIFSIVQPMLLGRVRNDLVQSPQPQPVSDFIPFVGLISWMLSDDNDDNDNDDPSTK